MPDGIPGYETEWEMGKTKMKRRETGEGCLGQDSNFVPKIWLLIGHMECERGRHSSSASIGPKDCSTRPALPTKHILMSKVGTSQ
jgi:hypothetical protein